MHKRDENSVLTSLKDLKAIEEDRLQREERERQARADAERRAREEAEQLARLEQERRRREAEQTAQAAEQARLREEREAKLRLEEAERAARIDAEARLEVERLRLEHEQRANGHSRPRWILPTFIGIALAVLGTLGYLFGVYLPDRQRARDAEERRRVELVRQQAEKERKELLDRLAKQESKLQEAIANAKSQQELIALKKQLKVLQEEQAVAKRSKSGRRTRPTRWAQRTPPKGMDKPPMKPDRTVRNNPLRGIFGDP